MHVDGFRFDLATALTRERMDVDERSPFLAAVHQDPVLRQVKLIAEPWDVGPGGYRLGMFGSPWAEWNDAFRDDVRGVLARRADAPRGPGRHGLAAHRVAGHLPRPLARGVGQLRHRPRRLHPARPRLLRQQAQRGQRRGQPRRHGQQPVVEPRRRGPDRRRRRSRQRAGARCARCSRPSCSRPARRCSSWATRWAAPRAATTTPTTRTTRSPGSTGTSRPGRPTSLRWTDRPCSTCAAHHPALRQTEFFDGRPLSDGRPADLTWLRPDGTPMTDAEWHDRARARWSWRCPASCSPATTRATAARLGVPRRAQPRRRPMPLHAAGDALRHGVPAPARTPTDARPAPGRRTRSAPVTAVAGRSVALFRVETPRLHRPYDEPRSPGRASRRRVATPVSTSARTWETTSPSTVDGTRQRLQPELGRVVQARVVGQDAHGVAERAGVVAGSRVASKRQRLPS